MSITTSQERARDVGGTQEGSILSGDDRRVWDVVTNSVADTKYTLIASGFYPVYGNAHPNNPLSTVRMVEYDRQGKFYWVVTADYSTKPETQAERDVRDIESPLDRQVVIRWTGTSVLEAIDKDKDGDAILNSAGMYFDPPVEVKRPHFQVTAQKNYATVPASALSFQNSINSDACTLDGVNFAAQTLMIEAIDISELKFENGVDFRTVTVVYEYNKATWELSVLDQGLFFKDGTDHSPCVDVNGDAVTAPVPLDGSGGQLANPSTSNAVFVNFDVYDLMTFTGSGLPGIT